MMRVCSITLLTGVIVAGCSTEHEVRVQVPPALLNRAALIEIAIVPSCAGQSVDGVINGQPIVRYAPGETPPALGDVDHGDRGLFARLVDDTCQVIAAGCTPVRIDGDGALLRVAVTDASGGACGSGVSCNAGLCGDQTDAGTRDASVDAADVSVDSAGDALVDGGSDAQVDAGPDDAGIDRPYTGADIPGLTSIIPVIETSRVSGIEPAAVHVSAMSTSAAGSDRPYEDLEFSWDFGDAEGGTILDPNTGMLISPNTEQVGPEAAYVYRRPGRYTITLRVRGSDGTRIIREDVERDFVVLPWTGEDRYFDAVEGSDDNDGLTPGTAWQSIDQLRRFLADRTLRNEARRAFIKSGTTMRPGAATNTINIRRSVVRVAPYGAGTTPYILWDTGTPLFNLTSQDGIDDVVIQGIHIDVDGAATSAVSGNVAPGQSMRNLAFIDMELSGGTERQAIFTTSTGTHEGMLFWGSTLGTGASINTLWATNVEYFGVVGCTLNGSIMNNPLLRLTETPNTVVRWTQFNATGSGRCITVQARAGDLNESTTTHFLVDANRCAGSNDGITVGIDNARRGLMDGVIIQRNTFEDLVSGPAVSCRDVSRLIVRDNILVGGIGANCSDDGIVLNAYRND